MNYLYSVFMHFFLKFVEWDSDIASIHLIPPSPQGCKGPGKMSSYQAENIFKKGTFGPIVCLKILPDGLYMKD